MWLATTDPEFLTHTPLAQHNTCVEGCCRGHLCTHKCLNSSALDTPGPTGQLGYVNTVGLPSPQTSRSGLRRPTPTSHTVRQHTQLRNFTYIIQHNEWVKSRLLHKNQTIFKIKAFMVLNIVLKLWIIFPLCDLKSFTSTPHAMTKQATYLYWYLKNAKRDGP